MEKEHSKLTLNKLTGIIEDVFSNTNSNRNFILRTGKGGAIEYEKAVLKEIGVSEEEIKIKEASMNKSMKDGVYLIDDTGIHYEEVCR